MQPTETFFSGFTSNDLLFLGEAALRTLWISLLAISCGSLMGIVFGWLLSVSKIAGGYLISPVLDIFRSVPLIIQLVLFYLALIAVSKVVQRSPWRVVNSARTTISSRMGAVDAGWPSGEAAFFI